jgi:hypothetical protein
VAFTATFHNISVGISWWSVLLVEETGVSVENHMRYSKNMDFSPFVNHPRQIQKNKIKIFSQLGADRK